MTDAVIDALIPGVALVANLSSWFGLERAGARVLVALFQNEQPMTADDLAACCQTTRRTIVVYLLPMLRQALDCEAIDRDERGYWLTDTGRDECKAALRRMGEELRRAS